MNNNTKTQESIIVRGICQSILAMAYPTLSNLNDLLNEFKFKITTIDGGETLSVVSKKL